MDIQRFPLTIRKLDEQDMHVHYTIWPQMIFVLSGSVVIKTGNISFTMRAQDLIMINAFDYFSCSGAEGEIIVLTFYTNLLPAGLVRPGEYRYECLPWQEDPRALGYLKDAVFKYLEHYINGGTMLTNIADTLLILDILQRFFVVDDEAYSSSTFSHIRGALSFIGENYARPITMKEAADFVGCSPNYFSTIFKNAMGISFTEYMDNFRLTYAYEKIIHTRHSLADIAEQTGFASDAALSRAFKRQYGMLPGAYREVHKAPSISGESLNWLKEDKLIKAKHTAGDTVISDRKAVYKNTQPQRIRVDLPEPFSKKLPVMPNKIFTIFPRCNLSDLLNAQTQRLISEYQKLCRFEYIKIPGIFSEALHICMAVRNGGVVCQFDRLDLIIDFVLENNLKPIIDLGGMPQILAGDRKYIRFFGYDLGAPKDNMLWADLVRQTLEHLCQRYTVLQVESWRFVSWAEPEFAFLNVWPDREAFFEFYRVTVETVRGINPAFKIGTPPFDAHETVSAPQYFTDFIRWCSRYGCVPDFIQISFYPEERTVAVDRGQAHLKHLPLDQLDSGFDEFTDVMKRAGLEHIPLMIKEYGNTRAQSIKLNDTMHGAAMLAGLCRALVQKKMPMSLAGFVEAPVVQFQVSHVFWGSNCLLTSSGIKKASWFLMDLLAKLGKEIIHCDDYCMVTRQDGHICGMISYAARPDSVENVSLDLDDDVGFWPVEDESTQQESASDNSQKELVMEINIGGMTGETRRIREYLMDPGHTCAYMQWQAMGEIEQMSREDVKYLNNICEPRISYREVPVINGKIRYIKMLHENEVIVFEVL